MQPKKEIEEKIFEEEPIFIEEKIIEDPEMEL